MCRIGIITLSASDNCGSLLQAYALRYVVSSLTGLEVEVINFSSLESHGLYDISLGVTFRKCRNPFRVFTKYKKLVDGKMAYKVFREEFIKMKLDKEIFPEELAKETKQFDIVIVGSDQVWNTKMGDFNRAFFAGWFEGKKIAYGPSIGGHVFDKDDDIDEIKEWISDFKALSAREHLGKECIERVVPRKATLVADPTLLVEKEHWQSLIGEPIIEEEYIFFYSWAYIDESTKNIVMQYSLEKKLPVYVVDAHKWISQLPSTYGFQLCDRGGPQTFLSLMFYAKKCFVESFHGMIFAYLFEKDFWLLDVHQDLEELDSRLSELVELLDVKERVLTKFNLMEKELDAPLLYHENERLEKLKKVSYEFLQEAITKE